MFVALVERAQGLVHVEVVTAVPMTAPLQEALRAKIASSLGKTVELAGDELTETQIAETFARVIGRPVKLASRMPAEGQQPSPEQIAMFKFFNGQGYDADIPALRKMYPQLKTLERYLRENGWENAQPTPETQNNWGR